MLYLQFHRLPPWAFFVYITLLPGLSYLQSISNQLNILFWLLDHIWSKQLAVSNFIPHTLGVSHISRQNSYSFCPKSTQWSILIFSSGQGFLQGATTLKMHKSSIDHISHILRMAKILLHRVTTHKIHISTNDANFIHSQLITISRFSITCLNSTPQENVLTSTTPLLLLQTQLSSTSFLLLGAFSGKVPCSITTKTYYFWQVSRFPFWATVEVVPWLLAPVTGDMT